MSRTIRRKNAWDKKKHTNWDQDWIDHMSGQKVFPYISFQRRKYNGCTDEQIKKRINAKFHSDNWKPDFVAKGRKDWSKWWSRNQLNNALQIAIKNGTEDEIINDLGSLKRRMNGWWLWWD